MEVFIGLRLDMNLMWNSIVDYKHIWWGVFFVYGFFECVVVCKDMQGMNQYKSLKKIKLIL